MDGRGVIWNLLYGGPYMTTCRDLTDLPTGIYYERGRDRYRVRLHKYGKVVHRSYHESLQSALDALDLALAIRSEIARPAPKKEQLLTTENLLAELAI